MEQTRERILEHVAEMLAQASMEDVTVAAVAKRAKVSVRTAYRYFPTKDVLIDSFNEWMGRKVGTPKLPTTLEELPAMAAALFMSFERNEQLTRAAQQSTAAGELRKRRKAEQVRSVIRAISSHAPELDEATVKKVGCLVHAIVSSDMWLKLRDNWKLTTTESIEAVQWGIDAIVAKLESERARKGRK